MFCLYKLSRIPLFLVSLLSYFFVIFIEIAWIFPLRFYQFSSQNITTFINSLKILITCTVVQTSSYYSIIYTFYVRHFALITIEEHTNVLKCNRKLLPRNTDSTSTHFCNEILYTVYTVTNIIIYGKFLLK
jgi:hypothetical protein